MECPECHKQLKVLRSEHAKIHGFSLKEFKKKYGLSVKRVSPFKGKKHTEESKQKCREGGNVYNSWVKKYGKEIADQKQKQHIERLSVYKNWVRKYGKEIADEKNKIFSEHKSLAVSGENNPFFGKTHSVDCKEKMSKSKATLIASGKFNPGKNAYGTKGYYFSSKNDETFYYDSLLEKYRMMQLDEDVSVVRWTKKHGIKIEYKFEEKARYYVPDFLIITTDQKILEETKGYDLRGEIKKAALKTYCENNGYKFSWKSQNEFKNYRLWLKTQKENLNGSVSPEAQDL